VYIAGEKYMRFTRLKQNDNNKYFIDENKYKIEDAVQKLAVFENMCEEFIKDMTDLPRRLEKMRSEGKEKTVAYRELVAQKLINTNIFMFFKRHGVHINNIINSDSDDKEK
jgi:hypothetical protein